MSTVVFAHHGMTRYSVRFNYSRDLVDLLKLSVPSFARSWNPQAKEWLVEVDWAPVLAATLVRAGHTVVGIDLKPPHGAPPTNNGANDHAWALGVFRRVGPDRTDTVYRMLSKALHPDVGGSNELMRELNEARRSIEKGDQ